MKVTDVILGEGMIMQVKGSRETVLRAIRDEREGMYNSGLLDIEINHRNLDGTLSVVPVSINVDSVTLVGSERDIEEGKDALVVPPYIDTDDTNIAEATI